MTRDCQTNIEIAMKLLFKVLTNCILFDILYTSNKNRSYKNEQSNQQHRRDHRQQMGKGRDSREPVTAHLEGRTGTPKASARRLVFRGLRRVQNGLLLRTLQRSCALVNRSE